MKQTTSPSGGMGRRVYTGMVPDFGGGGDVDGMLLSDVRPGGPAEKAGLTGGDVVVEFAGKSIGSPAGLLGRVAGGQGRRSGDDRRDPGRGAGEFDDHARGAEAVAQRP